MTTFQCSSASRKFLNTAAASPAPHRSAFQCSSASRKFLNMRSWKNRCAYPSVSVLFSEPKIPQSLTVIDIKTVSASFSALQRAENSSIITVNAAPGMDERVSVLFSEPKIPQFFEPDEAVRSRVEFQCSSASRKFLNSASRVAINRDRQKFQCSSASRKFLNISNALHSASARNRFSALQRAENSSIVFVHFGGAVVTCFSALQRAENSSIPSRGAGAAASRAFQCSSASRKFLNAPAAGCAA